MYDLQAPKLGCVIGSIPVFSTETHSVVKLKGFKVPGSSYETWAVEVATRRPKLNGWRSFYVNVKINSQE